MQNKTQNYFIPIFHVSSGNLKFDILINIDLKSLIKRPSDSKVQRVNFSVPFYNLAFHRIYYLQDSYIFGLFEWSLSLSLLSTKQHYEKMRETEPSYFPA